MPKYSVTVKVRLRETIYVTAFDQKQAEDYVWANLVDDAGYLIDEVNLYDYDVDDIEVSAYERP